MKQKTYVYRYQKSRKKYGLRRLDYILIGVMAVAAVMLAVILINYARDRKSYEIAQSLAVQTPAPTAAVTLAPEATPSPAPSPTPPVTVDFAAIQAEGRHVQGWIYSEGTIINYPVTYYTNNDYYLTHDYTGKRSNAGALLFDTRVGKTLLGDNLIIYGHHMKDRSMFGSLLQYQKQDYYEAHPVLYLLTPAQNYRIELFSAHFAESKGEDYPVWFGGEAEKKTYVTAALHDSDFTPKDAQYREGSRMITLVTCAYSNYIKDAKYRVMGWLVPIG